MLSNDEKKIIANGSTYRHIPLAKQGYPVFIRHGKTALEQRVNYVDLTQLFEDEERSVYLDAICHFNKLGLETIADEIAIYLFSESQFLRTFLE